MRLSCPRGGGTTIVSRTMRINSKITITGNGHTLSGGGIKRVVNATHSLTLNNLTIRDGKTSGASGAGIVMTKRDNSDSPLTLTINNSAFIDNIAGGINTYGGAIFTQDVAVNITNSTFSGNTAFGGGAVRFAVTSHALNMLTVNLIHVTVSNTNNLSGSSASVEFFGTSLSLTGNIRNSIIANNISGIACAPALVTVTNTLIEGTNDCGTTTLTSDPDFAGLTTGNYYPLLDTSPAIGAGDPTYCTTTDQTGSTRPDPAGTTCDIGAIESSRGVPLQPSETPTPTDTALPRDTALPTETASPTITPTYTPSATASATRVRLVINVDADCSLPDAVIAANTDSNTHNSNCEAGMGDDIISLPAGGTTTLSATLDITSNITIWGNGHTISGNNAVRVFILSHSNSNLTLNNVTVQEGSVSDSGGAAIHVSNSAAHGRLTVNNSTFKDNNATGVSVSGGAIFSWKTITLRNSTFTGNRSRTNRRRDYCETHRPGKSEYPIQIYSSDRNR